jgi:hypothetical protein
VPVIGIVAGTVLSAFFGDLDITRVTEAHWIGIPSFSWPGFDLSFGVNFWVLLPAFVIVTVVGATETFGEGIELSIGVAPLHDDNKDLIDASQSVKPLSMSKLPFQILGELAEDLQHYHYFGLDYISLKVSCTDSAVIHTTETEP